MSLPLTPKSRTLPLMLREYTIPVKHSGHQVTAIGFPATTSFTISWLESILTEYALASPSNSTPKIISCGSYS